MKKAFLSFFCFLQFIFFPVFAFSQGVTFHYQTPDEIKTFALPSPSPFLKEEKESGVSLTFSFLGDCTLGGTEKMRRNEVGFDMVLKDQSYTYPFKYLSSLFSQDDFTLINLEGTFADKKNGENKEKKFAFRGNTDYISFLLEGSIEGVNLANNHIWDYGTPGMKSTLATLDAHHMAYGGEGWLSVMNIKGVIVGIGGTGGNFAGEKQKQLRREIALLKESGCEIIIYSLHGGQEYSYSHNKSQEKIAYFLIDEGVDLIIGHHPHVVQGVEQYQKGYIFYSLGNGVFGGNHRPKDLRALVAQVVFHIDQEKNLKTITPSLYPIHISGTLPLNNYQPVLLEGELAEEVLALVEKDSSLSFSPFTPSQGSLLPQVQSTLNP